MNKSPRFSISVESKGDCASTLDEAISVFGGMMQINREQVKRDLLTKGESVQVYGFCTGNVRDLQFAPLQETALAKQYIIEGLQNLKAVRVFYPASNNTESALFDVDRQVLIGLCDDPIPYHPAGGRSAIESIVESGLVPGSKIWGIACEHICDETYRLTRI